MQSDIIVKNTGNNSIESRGLENLTILQEMEQMGIDPDPFLEIAARDLINQFGQNALEYSIQIEQNFIEAENLQSAIIWGKISSFLSEWNDLDGLITH